jgi:type I restriction enzyme, S subunit
MKFGLEDDIITKLNEVFEASQRVDKALIFGSRAKGNYRTDSDIDIAIKGEGITLDDILKMQVDFEEKGIKYKIDLVHYNTIQEKALLEHINRVGVEIYSRWKNYNLGEVLTFQRGYDLTRSNMKNGEYPVAGSNGIIGYHNEFTTTGPGVTIGRSGNIGTPQFYKKNYWAHNTVLFVKEFKLSDPKFIYYYLNTIDFAQFNAGSSVPTLNRNHVHKLSLLLPPLDEQIKIAEVLTSIEDKMNLLQRQNKTLEQLAKTLFRQWFVEETQESGEEKHLGEILEFVVDNRGKTAPTSEVGIPLIATNCIKNSNIFPVYEKVRFISADTYENWFRAHPKPGDIIFVNKGTPGCVNLVPDPVDFCIAQDMIALRVNNSIISNYFLFLYLRLESTQTDIKNMSVGTTIPHIKKTDLLKLLIAVPDKSKLLYFNNSVNVFFDKMNKNQIQIRTLTLLRDTLLPKLVSGEVRIDLEGIRLKNPAKSKKPIRQ